ncbi:MAG TPA: protease pro-enzyme activation domain-containing protein, partial [Desulfuromonadaceae bacterium]|nr:protease pro-enzyme activation domain-containing protein [Desulfuromonadaceae bacterium]
MVIMLAVLISLTAQGQPTRQALPEHVHQIASRLPPVGTVASTRRLRLAVGLPLRNQTELDAFLQSVSDPADPNYRHYLTPEEFAERYGPSEQDYQTVSEFFRTNGFTITGTHANRLLLDVSGDARAVERVFHVNLRTYRHPRENRDFFAPDAEPSIDVSARVLSVSGLSDFSKPRPRSHPSVANAIVAKAGSGPGGTWMGNDFRVTYAPGVTLTGSGQTVALVQFDGYFLKDITNYENAIGLTPATYVPLTNILVDGYSGTPTSTNGTIEVSLDIEMVIAMAPGVSRILVYEGDPNNFIPNDTLNRIAVDNAARQISSSWGWSGGQDPTTEQIFKQMIAQGQTYFNASGDSDAFVTNQLDSAAAITQPSASTNIIQVGGTVLVTTNPVSETAWNRGAQIDLGPPKVTNYIGTSGGISLSNAIPSWQTGISMVTNHGSTTRHNVPDVAMTGESVHVKYGNGASAAVGGTSVAAPLWAGFTALINQRAAQVGQPPVGFINPAIYALGKSTNYSAVFNDVTSGNNFWPATPTNFPAVPGYDLCTGWGTPRAGLINALAAPDPFGVTPGAGITFFGPVGGGFNPSAQTFILTNSGLFSSYIWKVGGVPSWLKVTPATGVLDNTGAHPATNVIVSLNAFATNLPAGIYSTNLVFTNTSTGFTHTRTITFLPGQSLVMNGGFENGGILPWILLAKTGDPGVSYEAITTAANYVHSGTYTFALGAAGVPDYFTAPLATVPGQRYLVSFWLRNPTGATPNQFLMNWNTNLLATNTVLNLNNLTSTSWTNFTFILTAAGSNTVLQFGARNDGDYFGFDDVTVQALPVPTFRGTILTNNQIRMTFNSLSSMQYQVQFSTNLS